MRRDDVEERDTTTASPSVRAELVELACGAELRGYHTPERWVWLLCLKGGAEPLVMHSAGRALH